MIFLIILLGLIFGAIAWRNFRAAAFVLICLFPAYLLRFNFGPLPSTALELALAIFFATWLLKYARTDRIIIKKFFIKNPWFAGAFVTFLIASVASIFVSDMWWYSLGEWRAYFLEPMVLFIIFIGRREMFDKIFLINALLFSTLSITIFGIFQKISGYTLPSDGRATSFFTSPNAVGLYLGPIMALSVYLLIRDNQSFKKIFISWQFWALLLCLTTIYFTKSLGTVLALIGGSLLLLWLLNRRRLAASILILAVLAGLFLAPFRSLIASKDQSGVNRLILWQYSMEYLTKSPQNFIFGTGVRQFFRKIQKPHYNVKQLERLIYPHNIILNFWTETGLLGMLSFTILYVLLMVYALRSYRREQKFGACLFAMLATILLHGLIDVPYFKNDLALLFWLISAFIINTAEV